MKILIIDADQFSSALLTKTLTSYAYSVDVVTDQTTGLSLAHTYTYDLIIAAVTLPDGDGIQCCQQLRAQGDRTPVLLLTTQDTRDRMAGGLDAGADDYVTKPLDLVEVMARVRALLRRKDLSLVPPAITWGDLSLNPGVPEVTYRGQPLALTPKEYGLLELFLQNPQRVFSRSTILDRIWPADVAPMEGTVTNHIKELRQKLKAAGLTTDLIETVYGLGYRLKSPPANVAPQVPPGPAATPSPPAVGDRRPTTRVMIVDDDRATLEAVNYLLSPWGIAVTGLADPAAFWDVLPQAAPQLLILNLELLTFNSLHLCHQIRQDQVWGDLPILAMTAHRDPESVQRLFASGVDDFVSQPIVGPELVTRVISRLERVRWQQQPDRQPPLQPLTSPPRDSPTPEPDLNAAGLTPTYADILLVDDQPNNLRVLAAILSGQGYKVRKASTGADALDAIATQPPDVILLDIRMPGMNGYEVCAALQTQVATRAIPVLFLSALDDPADKMKAFTVGGADYIIKPFQAEEVLARIKYQLILRQQQRQLATRNSQLLTVRTALQESEAQFRHAFAALTVGVGWVGRDDRWLKVNPALCQMLGYSAPELLTTPITTIVDQADQALWQQQLQQVFQQAWPTSYLELQWWVKGDRGESSQPFQVHLALIQDSQQQPLYVLVQCQPGGDRSDHTAVTADPAAV